MRCLNYAYALQGSGSKSLFSCRLARCKAKTIHKVYLKYIYLLSSSPQPRLIGVLVYFTGRVENKPFKLKEISVVLATNVFDAWKATHYENTDYKIFKCFH